jgi:hypothetical protein
MYREVAQVVRKFGNDLEESTSIATASTIRSDIRHLRLYRKFSLWNQPRRLGILQRTLGKNETCHQMGFLFALFNELIIFNLQSVLPIFAQHLKGFQ